MKRLRHVFRRASDVVRRRGGRGLFVHSLRYAADMVETVGTRNPSVTRMRDELATWGRFDSLDAVSARVLPDDVNPSLPLASAAAAPPPGLGPVVVIAHVYYTDLLPELLTHIAHIPVPCGLFLSTDTEEKRTAIAAAIEASGMRFPEVDIRLTPNVGRDIAPKIVTFADVYDRYEIFLHLHTKKSLHAGSLYAGWRKYLLDHLIGSPATAARNLEILASGPVGVVYPEHPDYIRSVINWGGNFLAARGMLRSCGIDLEVAHILEFPAGSMFWGRSAALRPLLDLGLTLEDFPPEAGQVDGTLAHAIERSMLFFVEAAGFEWRRTTLRDASHPFRRFRPIATSNRDVHTRVMATSREVMPLMGAVDRSPRPRLNLLVPTVRSEMVFGGVATALKIFRDLASGVDADLRVLATDVSVLGAIPTDIADYDVRRIGEEVAGPRTLVDCSSRAGRAIDLRAGDVFIGTAWWTAELARTLQADQRFIFGSAPRTVYLIQDYEPSFYGWSSRFAVADATYRMGNDTVAIFNSEELAEFLLPRHPFPVRFVLPYAPNARVAESLRASPRERIILFYARPSATRNCFEIGIDALALWARRNPVEARRWTIFCIGEDVPRSLVQHLPNVQLPGKMSLEDYAALLSRAAVGISLMVSPHPSYPPLEMAFAGLRTITNGYENKDLSLRSPLIRSLDALTTEALAAAIDEAVVHAEPDIGTPTAVRTAIRDLASDLPRYDRAAVLAALAPFAATAGD